MGRPLGVGPLNIRPCEICNVLHALPSPNLQDFEPVLDLIPIKYSLNSSPLTPRHALPARACCCRLTRRPVDTNDIEIGVVRAGWTPG